MPRLFSSAVTPAAYGNDNIGTTTTSILYYHTNNRASDNNLIKSNRKDNDERIAIEHNAELS